MTVPPAPSTEPVQDTFVVPASRGMAASDYSDLSNPGGRGGLRPALLIHDTVLVLDFPGVFLGRLKVARAARRHGFSLCLEQWGSKQVSPSVQNPCSLLSSPLAALRVVSGSARYSSRLAVLGLSGHTKHHFLSCVYVNLYMSVGSLPSKSWRAESVSPPPLTHPCMREI